MKLITLRFKIFILLFTGCSTWLITPIFYIKHSDFWAFHAQCSASVSWTWFLEKKNTINGAQKTPPTHQYPRHMNIKEKRTFWDRLAILMSWNKNILFIQFCKELPKAPNHPTLWWQDIPPRSFPNPSPPPMAATAIPSTLQKTGQSSGKGLVQNTLKYKIQKVQNSPCTKWH